MRTVLTTSILATGLLTFLLASCGPSQAEIELKQLKDQAWRDSLEVTEAASAKLLADSLQGIDDYISEMEQRLIQAKADLATTEDRLNQVSQVQLLRTREEREQQVHDATVEIEETKGRIEKLESNIKDWKKERDRLSAQGLN